MEAFLQALQASDIAQALRFSRWGYAAVNAAHILGIALLVGAILPLDLRLLGLWRGVPLGPLVRVLSPSAAFGLALAMAAGAALFATRATEYAGLAVVQLKLALVATGALSALALHLTAGFRLERASRLHRMLAAAISMTCWLGALACGRLIAFVD